MVTICQQCGDEGAPNAFVYCVECLNFSIHRYCLHVLPKTRDEFVPWLCEDCEPRVPNKSTRKQTQRKVELKKKKSLKRRYIACLVAGARTKHDSAEHAQLGGNCSPLKKKIKKGEKDVTCSVAETEEQRLRNSPNHGPAKACTKMDPDEHFQSEADKRLVLTEHAELVSDCSPLKMESDKKTEDNTRSIAETKEQMNDKQDINMVDDLVGDCSTKNEEQRLQNSPNHGPDKGCTKMDPSEHFESETYKRLVLTEHAELVSDCSPLKMESDKKTEDNTSMIAETKDQMDDKQDINMVNALVGDCSTKNEEKRIIRFCSENNIKDLRLENDERLMIDNGSESGNEVSQSAKFSNNSQHNYHEPAQPVIEPIWRGSFNIFNKDDDPFEGFVAHVSSKACYKVCEEANMLPSLLGLEMLPKSALWPKSFEESEPSDDNIALYFFPADTKHERAFDRLVADMTSEELAMRAIGNNAELLIFTSRELPISYWRFQGKYYLWGVFKGKKSDSSPPANHHLMVPKKSGGCIDVVNGQRAQSPPSPLCIMSEHGMDMDLETGD